jgi:hypothetical protein
MKAQIILKSRIQVPFDYGWRVRGAQPLEPLRVEKLSDRGRPVTTAGLYSATVHQTHGP